MDVERGTVCIAYLHPGQVSHSYLKSERDYRTHDLVNHQRLRGFIEQECGASRVVDGRNDAVRKFLGTPFEWLMFIDSDMGFEADAIDRLIDQAHPTDRPIVGGLCFGQKKGPKLPGGARRMLPVPTLYRWSESESQAGFAPWYDWPRDQLVEVDATGGAFLLIHRTVLETLADGRFPYPREWFDETLYKGQVFSEDLTFCRRATEAGFKIHIDTSVHVTHHKDHYLTVETVGDLTSVPTFVVIPFKNRADLTRKLLRQLREQGGYEKIFLYDNGSNTATRNWAESIDDPNVVLVDADGWNIHQMWNDGLDRAQQHAWMCNVAILNNDLEIGGRFLDGLSKALRADPLLSVVGPNYDGRDGTGVEYVETICANRYDGTGGLPGFAFMIKGEAGYRFPTDLNWWFGDNDMLLSALSAGTKVGLVLDVECVHVDGGGQTGDWKSAEMQPLLEQDRKTFEAKWMREVA